MDVCRQQSQGCRAGRVGVIPRPPSILALVPVPTTLSAPLLKDFSKQDGGGGPGSTGLRCGGTYALSALGSR